MRERSSEGCLVVTEVQNVVSESKAPANLLVDAIHIFLGTDEMEDTPFDAMNCESQYRS